MACDRVSEVHWLCHTGSGSCGGPDWQAAAERGFHDPETSQKGGHLQRPAEDDQSLLATGTSSVWNSKPMNFRQPGSPQIIYRNVGPGWLKVVASVRYARLYLVLVDAFNTLLTEAECVLEDGAHLRARLRWARSRSCAGPQREFWPCSRTSTAVINAAVSSHLEVHTCGQVYALPVFLSLLGR